MAIAQRILKHIGGTRIEPIFEGLRRSTWPKLRTVGEKDHVALNHALAVLAKRNWNCVDVGANKGEMIELITTLAPAGKHVAFEPIDYHAKSLRERFPQVDVRQNAVANKAGQVTFNIDLNDDALSGLLETDNAGQSPKRQVTVDVVRIDDVLEPARPIHFLKIDVEGAELDVLKGARETLKRHRPVVAFEFQLQRAPAYNVGPRDFYQLLMTDLGYTLFSVDGVGPLDIDAFQAAFDDGTSYNFLARDY